ncbi:MAG: hypothetical protein QW061_00980 [Candidatus Rehaiarchaeum fermentans]|nr:hypothetical protein [Candidatus Rehaiarchaeum fermentans]MCW1292341.1 hypothetical protein [Candidatus Rehaiarchaeum fermentans]MCW1293661.1 hypothetical protein [Candidatus Rehaiarchaeum fermentans]MCW1297230.1 hypothetical protein [Candidatus Rehaiarchaeum fermentans]
MKIRIAGTLTLLVKPKEEAEKAIREVMSSLIKNAKDYKIDNVKYAEPAPLKDDFYSIYSNFEVEGEVEKVFGAVMDYGIENIEVLSPNEVVLKASEIQSILNDISGVVNALDAKIKYYSAQFELLKREYGNRNTSNK